MVLKRCASGGSFAAWRCQHGSFIRAPLAVVPHVHDFPDRESGVQDGVHAKVTLPSCQPRRRVVNAADHCEAADSGVNRALECFCFTGPEEAFGCHMRDIYCRIQSLQV